MFNFGNEFMKRRLQFAILLFSCLGGFSTLAAPFTADHLVQLDRVGAPGLSPDGDQVVFAKRSTDMDADKGRYDLWVADINAASIRQLTSHESNETDPAWSPDQTHIYYLSSRSESSQVWRIAVDGGEATQVTELPVDIGSFRVTADGDRLIVSLQTYLDCEDLACTAARDKELDA